MPTTGVARRPQIRVCASYNPLVTRPHDALLEAGCQDLIGNGCDCLIAATPPREAIDVRRKRANDPDHCHTVANPATGEPPGEKGLPNYGYRPDRKTARRQEGKKKGRR